MAIIVGHSGSLPNHKLHISAQLSCLFVSNCITKLHPALILLASMPAHQDLRCDLQDADSAAGARSRLDSIYTC